MNLLLIGVVESINILDLILFFNILFVKNEYFVFLFLKGVLFLKLCDLLIMIKL